MTFRKLSYIALLVCVAIAVALSVVIYLAGRTTPPATRANWYRDGWKYRKRITIHHKSVAGPIDLRDFPMLVSMADSDLRDHVSPAGTDLLFTAGDGVTRLSYERESFTRKDGRLIAWVRIPALSRSTDTTIYLYYGDAGASDQQKATATWDAHYAIVAHFDNKPLLNADDSTSNRYVGSFVNGNISRAAGQVDGAADLTGDKTYIVFAAPDSLSVSTGLTWELWVKPDGWKFNYFGKQFSADGNANANTVRLLDGVLTYRREWNGKTVTWKGDAMIDLDAWSFVAVTYDGSKPSNSPAIYLNGISDGATCAFAFGSSTCQPTAPMNLPRGPIYLGGTTGLYDEFRYSDTVRSVGWIGTEYRNQAAPNSFYAVAAQESR